MKKVVEKILAKSSLGEIKRAIADEGPDSFENAHLFVNDTQVTEVGILISKCVTVKGVEYILTVGALGLLYKSITNCEQRQELLGMLLEDCGISKSQFHRCIDVWKCFAEALTKAPHLQPYFVIEALKILSAQGVDPRARVDAIQMASERKKVRIAGAKKLIAKYSQVEQGARTSAQARAKSTTKPAQNPQSLRGKAASSIWEYAGSAIRFVLRPTQSKQQVDHEAVIRDLEAALEMYRQEYARLNSESSNSVDHRTELTYV
ncbi:MAG: hypothetical protein AAGA30_00145 [Planctomycetota bacterium]